MSKVILAGLIFPLVSAGLVCHAQECGSALSPPSGHVFKEGESLCFSSDSPTGTPLSLTYPVRTAGQQGVLLYFPFYADLDNGTCLPRKLMPWDQPQQFTVAYSELLAGCTSNYSYSLQTSGGVAPQPINVSEVSFRKKDKKYYLRIVCERLSDDSACASLRLGDVALSITRYEGSGQSTIVEGLLGKEADFVRLASGPPSISFEDTCAGKVLLSPPIPPGKGAMQSFSMTVDPTTHKVAALELIVVGFTGCEVIFYSWWDPACACWSLRNLPTYGKYEGSKGYLPPSHRKIWKRGGYLVARQYDYCTGEFVGTGVPTGGR